MVCSPISELDGRIFHSLQKGKSKFCISVIDLSGIQVEGLLNCISGGLTGYANSHLLPDLHIMRLIKIDQICFPFPLFSLVIGIGRNISFMNISLLIRVGSRDLSVLHACCRNVLIQILPIPINALFIIKQVVRIRYQRKHLPVLIFLLLVKSYKVNCRHDFTYRLIFR